MRPVNVQPRCPDCSWTASASTDKECRQGSPNIDQYLKFIKMVEKQITTGQFPVDQR